MSQNDQKNDHEVADKLTDVWQNTCMQASCQMYNYVFEENLSESNTM